MHLSSHTWMRPESLRTTLARLSHLGYTSIELAGEPEQFPIEEARKLLEEYNIRCWGTVTIQTGDRDLTVEDPEQRRRTINYMKDVVSMAAELGGEIITIVPGRVGKIVPSGFPEEEWQWVVDSLREVVAHAKERNIRVGLEPLNRFETHFLNRTDQTLRLTDEVDYDYDITFDPFHLALEEKDLYAALRSCKGRIVDFHVADHNRLAAGDGNFDWRKMMAVLAETGFDGALAFEASPPIDRTPVGNFGNNQIETGNIEVPPAQLQFIIDHGSSVLSDEYYTGLLRRTAATLRGVPGCQLEHINVESGLLAFGDVEPGLGMQLLAAFWNRQHYTGTVVYRPVFMRDMACQGPYFTPLLLNAVFFVASKHSPKTLSADQASDLCEGGAVFRRAVEKLLYDKETKLLCRSRVTTIQALLLMSDALFSWCDERSLSWHYLGIAINMILDLGIHTTRSEFYRSGLAESLADKAQSIYQGRQCRLRIAESNVPISFLDEYEELEPFNTVTFAAVATQTRIPTRAVTTFEQTCKLSVIAEGILSALYTEEASSSSVEELVSTAQRLVKELADWKDSLPSHLCLEWNDDRRPTVLPHTLALMAMYRSLSILLHRPFVSGGHIGNILDSSVSFAFSTCTKAASEIDKILRLYVEHFCIKSCPYFLSYATYASATIHVRLAAQHAARSRAHQSLWFCLEALSEQQTRCHAPRQSMAILLELMKRLDVDVGKVFVAAKSRSDGMEGCQLGLLADATETGQALEDHDTNSWMNTALPMDDVLINYDLDAIMKTFDFSMQGQFASGEEVTSTNKAAESSSWPSDIVDDSTFQDECNGLTLDPLFGLDATIFDHNSHFI
ncbi:hypothetical protein PRZ48_010146 [Zasmidium cellare]|uniref:Xylose isomerase-like TIM barrel domain-containing protein n=1 Tax=Zasmidium cellare TaxID=395010 RepID=A0ABR0EEY5_ZASCE|nr:hypothetical protein PRZ48_010146 [Zasmidium cellare]